MYAVVFDLDTNCLGECYDGNSYHGAYKLIRDFLTENGFSHTQGFSTCSRDVRMLRIEDNNDLLPAIR